MKFGETIKVKKEHKKAIAILAEDCLMAKYNYESAIKLKKLKEEKMWKVIRRFYPEINMADLTFSLKCENGNYEIICTGEHYHGNFLEELKKTKAKNKGKIDASNKRNI